MKENRAFTIEGAVPEDAEELVAIYDYYVQNTAITFEYETPTAAEFRRRIENTLGRFPYLVLRQDQVGKADRKSTRLNSSHVT